MRRARIQGPGIKVFFSATYRPNSEISEEAKADLRELVSLIEQGKRLPERYYRKDINTTADYLLDNLGIAHLHLVQKNSDELVYLAQFPDAVIILEVGTHRHFHTVPIGKLLAQGHSVELSRRTSIEKGKDEDAALIASQANAEQKNKLALGLNRLKGEIAKKREQKE